MITQHCCKYKESTIDKLIEMGFIDFSGSFTEELPEYIDVGYAFFSVFPEYNPEEKWPGIFRTVPEHSRMIDEERLLEKAQSLMDFWECAYFSEEGRPWVEDKAGTYEINQPLC